MEELSLISERCDCNCLKFGQFKTFLAMVDELNISFKLICSVVSCFFNVPNFMICACLSWPYDGVTFVAMWSLEHVGACVRYRL